MAKEFLVKGAVCMCKFGVSPGTFTVLDNSSFYLNGHKLAGTTLSLGNTFDPPGFGTCKVNPAFPKPCVPSLTKWSSPFTGIKTAAGGNLLTESSKGTCASGGPDCISVIRTGQVTVPGASDYQKAAFQFQADIDPTGSPAGLTEHQIAILIEEPPEYVRVNPKEVSIVEVKGEQETKAAHSITYRVTKYNIPPSLEIRKTVRWQIEVDKQKEVIEQPNNDVFEVFVKDDWKGKEITVTAYLEATAANKASATTIVLNDDEYIIVIGTQQHSSNPLRNLSPFHGVGPNSKFMFVHQALRRVLHNKNVKWTTLLCSEGYSENQLKRVKATFEDIKSDAGHKVVTYKTVSSSDDILNYINKGKDRKRCKVGRLLFYSHGIVNEILPWMKGLSNGESFNKSVVGKIQSSAFSEDALVYSFACRTGLGNPDIDDSIYIDEKKGTRYNIKSAQSLAQKMADASNAVVYAYLKRTEYSDTLFTADDYDFLDACDAVRIGKKQERPTEKYKHIVVLKRMSKKEQERFNFLDRIRKTDEMIDDDIFRASGALYPIRAAETPRGLPDDMKTYRKQQS